MYQCWPRLRIPNDPTAAALAYGLGKKGRGEKTILIYVMGGGPFDAYILSIRDGLFEVTAAACDPHLCGEDSTRRIVDFCL